MADGSIMFRTVLVIAAGLALIMIIFHYNKSVNREAFSGGGGHARRMEDAEYPHMDGTGEEAGMEGFAEPVGSTEESSDLLNSAAPVAGGTPTAAIRVDDLLPKLGNSREEQQFAQLHPVGQGDVQGVNFLDASSLIGQSTSLKRNANHQLRMDPPIEMKNVSPWMMSTITPDTASRGLEIGSI